jgi:glycosyltransferase involved in cell wall biosynthesis
MLASIIIRTFNEQRYLGKLLDAIAQQQGDDLTHEVIVVDSGSTDATLRIASAHGARIVHIDKAHFSFGRSLNVGCEAAGGEVLVFVSGHCVPTSSSWLHSLVRPLGAGDIALTYGRQQGGRGSRFSEVQLFEKFYPAISQVPQAGFFCNNANSALRRDVWERFPFDEELTGLEDMHTGKRLVDAGLRIGYVAEAAVSHYHHETWTSVRRRYEREAIALQHILPEVHVTLFDAVRYFISAVMHDGIAAGHPIQAVRLFPEIVAFRLMQFWGSYRGNHEHRQLSQGQKERYFYPQGAAGEVVEISARPANRSATPSTPSSRNAVTTDRRAPAHEGEQRAREGKELPQVRR